MPRATALIVLASLALVTAAIVAPSPAIGTAALAARSQSAAAPSSGYLGSGACQRCHEPEYDAWRRDLHLQMTKPIAEARVLGDFSPGTRLQDSSRTYEMETRGGRYVISIAKSGRPPERFEIDYTLGARRFQGYLSKLPDGRIYVLPVFWHDETKRWIDYKEITPIPDDPRHEFRQIWNVTCVNCHATNIVRHFDAASNSFATTWTEMGVGCEACHGPGREHVDDPDHLKIFTMKKVPPRQIFDACGYCHGNKNNVFFGFKPGERYEDFALPFLISQPIPENDPQGDFWPDGRPSRFNRPQALTVTGCFQKGQATCTSCHRIHGPRNAHSLKVAVDNPAGGHTRQSDTLCTQCHAVTAEVSRSAKASAEREPTAIGDLRSHTHHDPASEGSRCINCHMSDVNWRLFTRRLDHTFQPPVPELTARYGAPNACTSCHEEKSPEWAAAKLDAWYGNADRRKAIVSLSDTIYRAGAGDVAALPDVAMLAVDRSHGTLIRASAAEFAGQLIAKVGSPSAGAAAADVLSPAILNALIGAANDQEAMVRITAVRALGLIREPRIMSVLAAHLTDGSRVVRVSAAEALMGVGVTTLDGAAGAALQRAQDEWTESLRTFDDDANDRSTLGWLEAARGRPESAKKELAIAVKLDPTIARPHVYLGVLAAREGRFDEALQQFRSAKSLAPTYPNIDKLIDEAQKRR